MRRRGPEIRSTFSSRHEEEPHTRPDGEQGSEPSKGTGRDAASASKWWPEHDGVQTSRRPGEDAEPRERVPGKKQGWRAGKMERGRGTLAALLSLPGPPGEKRGPAGRAGQSGGRGPGERQPSRRVGELGGGSEGEAEWGDPAGGSGAGGGESGPERRERARGGGRGCPGAGAAGERVQGRGLESRRAGCWGVKGGGRGTGGFLADARDNYCGDGGEWQRT